MVHSVEQSPRIIVHFGMHKTGSTSIQQSFNKNFCDDRFYYLNLNAANHSVALATAFRNNPSPLYIFNKNKKSDDEIRAIRKTAIELLQSEIENAINNNKHAIISAESISYMNEKEFSNFKIFLDKFNQPIKFFGYIRPPKSYIESIFQEQIKSGVNLKFNIQAFYPNYRKHFGLYDNLIFPDTAVFRKFDKKKFYKACVVRDFCKETGVDFSKITLRNANDGLSLPALQFLYIYKRIGPGFKVISAEESEVEFRKTMFEIHKLVKFISRVGGSKFRLHSQFLKPVIDSNRDDIAWMEERLGEPLDEDLSAHDNEAIRSEADLLTFSPEALRWLAEQLGPEYVFRYHGQMTPEEVATWVHALRLKLANRQPKPKRTIIPGASLIEGENTMKIIELVQQVKQASPAVADIPDGKARELVKEVLGRIRAELESADDGVLTVPALGTFRVKTTETEKDGQKLMVKRTFFRATPPPKR